jgi:hypothetical protein
VLGDGSAVDVMASYESSTEGTADCDAAVSYSAATFSGDCMDCDFAFELADFELDDGGFSDCAYYSGMALVGDEVATPTAVAFWYSYEYYDYYTYTTSMVYDLMAVGSALDYSAYGGSYYPGPYWEAVSGFDFTTGTWSGTSAASTWSDAGTDYTYDYYYLGEYCDEDVAGDVSDSYIGGADNTGSIPCGDDALVDRWTFDATGGEQIGVSVDTVAADTAFDPSMVVTGPDECFVASADDSFDCTFLPLDYQCTSTLFTAPTTGTYTVTVENLGSCTGTDGAYVLDWKVVE